MKDKILFNDVILYHREVPKDLVEKRGYSHVGILVQPKETTQRIKKELGFIENVIERGSGYGSISVDNISDHYTETKLKNSGFSFKLPYNTYDRGVYWNDGVERYPVILQHKDLKVEVVVMMYYFDLLNIISASGMVVRGEIMGSYCFYSGDKASLSEYPLLEDPGSDEQKEMRLKGNSLIGKQKTSNWIPGHAYLQSNRTYAICLCNCSEDILYNTRYYWGGNNKSKSLREVKQLGGSMHLLTSPMVFVEVESLKSNHIRNSAGNLYTLQEYLQKQVDNDLYWNNFEVRSSDSSKLYGVDMGEVLKVSEGFHPESFIINTSLDFVKREFKDDFYYDGSAGVIWKAGILSFSKSIFGEKKYRDGLIKTLAQATISRSQYQRNLATAEERVNYCKKSGYYDDTIGSNWNNITLEEITAEVKEILKKQV